MLWIYKSYYRDPQFMRKGFSNSDPQVFAIDVCFEAHGRSLVLGWATMPGAKDEHVASERK